jgi:hypothetical protein
MRVAVELNPSPPDLFSGERLEKPRGFGVQLCFTSMSSRGWASRVRGRAAPGVHLNARQQPRRPSGRKEETTAGC